MPDININEVLEYVEQHAAKIPVRERREDGTYHNTWLSELPPERRLVWAFLWAERIIANRKTKGD